VEGQVVQTITRALLFGILAFTLHESVVQGRQAGVAGDSFAPVPCPVQTFSPSDPSFEALPGAKAFAGRYEGGLYRIEVPASWNGELVLFAHGFHDPDGAQGSMLEVGDPGPLRAHVLNRGFAWAASSYRCNGYVPGIGLIDTMALGPIVATVTGRTAARVWLAGASMGGHTTILGLHEFPDAFAGGLAMCPAGPDTMDFLASVSAAAEAITGLQFGEGPAPPAAAALRDAFGTPAAYTPKGRQLASTTIHISGGPRPFAVEGLTQRFLANVRDGVRLRAFEPWNRAVANAMVTYALDEALGLTSAALNSGVRRRHGDPVLRSPGGPYDEVAAFDGRIERPLMALHGTGDLYVPITMQRALRRAVDAAGRAPLLVQRLMRIPGHCGFSRDEQIAAFDDLIRWAQTGRRADGDDVLGDLTDAGRRFTNPQRPGDPGGKRISAE
jgi:pimeloyl-ACP methyl ester carboxylesterase